MSEEQKTGRGLGIAALVLGILGVITSLIPCFGIWAITFGILSIVFGAVSISYAKKSGSKKSLGLAGLILGIIATAFTLLWYIFIIGAAATAISTIPELTF